MGRFAFIFLFAAVMQITLVAQPADRVEALRVAFISRRIDLGPAESEKFWPVYNEYHDKLLEIKKTIRQSYRKNVDALSEPEAEELLRNEQLNRQKEVQLHAVYGERLKAIIGARKMVKLRTAEEDFRKELMKTIRND